MTVRRIAMVGACPYPVPQGSQVLLRNTAQALHERGHDIHLVVYGHGASEATDAFPVHRAWRVPGASKTAPGPSWGKPLLDAALVAALRRVVKRHQIDIVHAHNYEGLLVALAAGKRPIVYHAHNCMADELPHFIKGSERFGRWLDCTFPKRADHIIVPQAVLRDYLIGCGCASEKVSVVPPCVAVHDFAKPQYHDGLPPVLYTGNLDRYQNLGFLGHVMTHVRHEVPETVWLMATAKPGAVPGAVFVQTDNLGSLRETLARDAVVVCPRVSWSGYPMKLLNAMAAGRPVVACQSAAYPITHEHDGLVVGDGDVEAFADAVLSLMRDPALRVAYGTNARATMEQSFDPARISDTMECIYEQLCVPGD